jgi:hypothetical protein
MVRYALASVFNLGTSGNQFAFKERPFTEQMQKEELLLLLSFGFIVERVCLRLLGTARDASANARHEGGQLDASF